MNTWSPVGGHFWRSRRCDLVGVSVLQEVGFESLQLCPISSSSVLLMFEAMSSQLLASVTMPHLPMPNSHPLELEAKMNSLFLELSLVTVFYYSNGKVTETNTYLILIIAS